MRYPRFATPFMIALMLLASTALAQEKAPKKAEEKKEDVPTYSTKDLKKKYGSSSSAREAAEAKRLADKSAAEGQPTPLDKMKASQAAAAKTKQDRAATEKELKQAQQEVARLETQLRALRNPLLARPSATEEEKKQQQGLSQADRIKAVEKNLTAAKAAVQAAQQKLKRTA
jgi:hypothetical protein